MNVVIAPSNPRTSLAKPPSPAEANSHPLKTSGMGHHPLSGTIPGGSSSAKPRPVTGLTLGELYLLTRPATWDPDEEANNARGRGGRIRSGSVSEGSEGRPGASRTRGGARSTRRKKSTPYYVAQSEDEDDNDDEQNDDGYAGSNHAPASTTQAVRRGGAPAVSPVPRAGATTSVGRGPGIRFKCTYAGCDKSFTREGDRARHLATTLHRGEMLSAARIAEIMAETRETHRQYCIRCKRIMLRVNSRRRHEENPGACGSRRGMPKDVIEGGRVEQSTQ